MKTVLDTTSRGFTLVELVVGVGIASLVLIALMQVIGSAFPLYRSTFIQSGANETARIQLKRLSHTIRGARPSDTGAFPIVEASPSRLIFYANVDGDASTERVRYELIGTDLVRGITKATGDPVTYDTEQESVTTVARYIRNDPVFIYYGSEYPGDTTPVASEDLSSITYISFSLVIDADTAQDPPAIHVQSQVQLRNLKTNL